jgi:hypothetical protein
LKHIIQLGQPGNPKQPSFTRLNNCTHKPKWAQQKTTNSCNSEYLGLAELPDRTFHCAKGGLISLDDQVRTTSRLMQKVAYVAHKRPERRQKAHNQSIAK